MRRLTRNCALVLLPALLITAFAATASALDGGRAAPASSGPTAQTTDAKHLPLQVYGEPTWPLQRGIDYWNDLAGRKVIHYAGRHTARAWPSSSLARSGSPRPRRARSMRAHSSRVRASQVGAPIRWWLASAAAKWLPASWNWPLTAASTPRW